MSVEWWTAQGEGQTTFASWVAVKIVSLLSVLDFCLVEGVQELSCFDLESLEHFHEPVVCSSP